MKSKIIIAELEFFNQFTLGKARGYLECKRMKSLRSNRKPIHKPKQKTKNKSLILFKIPERGSV